MVRPSSPQVIPLKNKKVAVLGVMSQGMAVIRFLHQQGARVTAYGLAGEDEAKSIRQELEGIPFELITQDIPTDGLKSAELIIVSSGGERRYKSQIESARQAKIPLLSDLELACEYYAAPIIAVTGSNGKTTVVHMIKTVLEGAGKKVLAAGGDYEEFAESILRSDPYDIVILELNSSRLMRTAHFRPNIAVFLNLYPGHSERHGGLEEYGDAKAKIFTDQTEEDFLIFQASQEVIHVIEKHGGRAKAYAFSLLQPIQRGAYFDKEKKEIVFLSETGEKTTFSYEKPGMKGIQNLENMLATVCVAKILKISDEAIQDTISSIQPLPNRLEPVQKIEGVAYINDARSVNVAATVTALYSCRDQSTVLIAGGEFKIGQLYENLNPLLRQKVKSLIIFGEDRLRLFEQWKDATQTFVVPTLKEAVTLASQKAEKGMGVLFSPACSPEMHTHATTQERGEEFKRWVKEMGERVKKKQAGVKRI